MEKQTRSYVKKLRAPKYNPSTNPLISREAVPIRRKEVRSNIANRSLIDAITGERVATSIIQQTELVDDQNFVKIFTAGIAASYALTKTGQRVFQTVLQEYEKTPMQHGFVDSVYLSWFDGGLCGRNIEMSEVTFNRGMWELLEKGFIAHKSPNLFWVNPALFFKGDRVLFIREYQKKKQPYETLEEQETERLPNAKTLAAMSDEGTPTTIDGIMNEIDMAQAENEKN